MRRLRSLVGLFIIIIFASWYLISTLTKQTINVVTEIKPLKINRSSSSEKIILHIGERQNALFNSLLFDSCEYSNCKFYQTEDIGSAFQGDVLIFSSGSNRLSQEVDALIRQRQIWLMYSLESPAYSHNKWDSYINGFNGSITYLQDSFPGSLPYGIKVPKSNSTARTVVDYAKGKTKGAFAYVSNCQSVGYDRLGTMKELGKYINVDIFGDCTKNSPCPGKASVSCEAKLHAGYKFYLAFENSMCKEYMTEKFWRSLYSTGGYVPVVVGGLSVDDYTRHAPPNSFIHAYNFSSVAQLGRYLKQLMADDKAFNRYHEWRQHYDITLYTSTKALPCKLCEAAHKPEATFRNHQNKRLVEDWNDASKCRTKVF